MTCVFDALIFELCRLGLWDDEKNPNRKPTPLEFVQFICRNNCPTTNVKYNGESRPSLKQLQENKQRIASISEIQIQDGYLCSTFDPLMFLICELFRVNINHRFCGNMCRYSYESDETMSSACIELNFRSDRSHFSIDS